MGGSLTDDAEWESCTILTWDAVTPPSFRRLRAHLLWIVMTSDGTHTFSLGTGESVGCLLPISTTITTRAWSTCGTTATLLLMNGCERELSCSESFGSVLIPEDILSEYLPAMAVMFGRVRVLASTNNSSGPLAMKTHIDATDHHILQSAATTSVILSALVVARRQWIEKPEFIRGKDDPHGWPHFAEIVAARSFAALLRLGLLPTCEDFVEVIQETIRTSGWLSALGIPVLRESFRELSRRANVIIETEDKFDAKHPPTPISAVKEGVWVCAPSTGVTEVLKVSGKNVELARIGESKKEKDRLMVMAKFVTPTGLTRC